MLNKTATIAALAFFMGMSFNVIADDDRDDDRGRSKHFVFNLIGPGQMYEGTVPDIDGDCIDDPAICFDTELVNLKTQRKIGTATDCLSNVTAAGSGLKLVGTSYFRTKKGTLITRGNTTVQPVLQPTVTPNGQNVTHITGASGDGNSIIGGTGRFANKTGTVRLSGMVDMANFGGNVGDPIVFDCIFVVDIN